MTEAPRVLAIQSDPTDPPALMGDWLAEAGVEVVVIRAFDGEVVPDAVPADVHGLLPLGGEMGANDDHVAPWLPATRSLLADAVANGVPVLGLCLGGQLLAAATGGRVGVAPVAEVGVVTMHLTDAAALDEVFAPARVDSQSTKVRAAEFHGDAILELPDGAVLLATNDACPVQAFRLRDNAYGVQFHPEIDPPTMESWVSDVVPLQRAGRVGDDLGAEMREAIDELVATWRPMAHAWAEVVHRYARTRTPQDAATP